MKETCG